MSNSDSNSGGTSIVGLLGVAFVVLKLTEVIDWSWWFVTMPFWGGAALVTGMLCGFGLMYGAGALTMKAGKVISNKAWDRANLKIVKEQKLLECPYMEEALTEVERIAPN